MLLHSVQVSAARPRPTRAAGARAKQNGMHNNNNVHTCWRHMSATTPHIRRATRTSFSALAFVCWSCCMLLRIQVQNPSECFGSFICPLMNKDMSDVSARAADAFLHMTHQGQPRPRVSANHTIAPWPSVLAVPPPSVPHDGVHRSEVSVCGVLQPGTPRDCPF